MKQKFISFFESLIEEEKKRGINLKKETNITYAFQIEDDEETQMDIQELLVLKGRKTNSDNDHLKPIHQIKLNLTVDLPSKLYYYKRWVWMNFPWICLYKSKKQFSHFIDGIEAQETRTGAVFLQCLGIVYMNRIKKESVLVFFSSFQVNGSGK